MQINDATMTIDGAPVRGTRVFEVEDPATGKVIASAPDATAGELGAELGTWGLECFTDLSIRHDALAVQARPTGMITIGE